MLAPLALAACLLVAILHVGFFVLETLLWSTPTGRKIFGQTKEQAAATKVLAGNQGVYNLALALALGWAALSGDAPAAMVLLGFVVFVGLYGAATAARSILFLQALPAALALVAVWMA